mgnify:CR=1 FL=1
MPSGERGGEHIPPYFQIFKKGPVASALFVSALTTDSYVPYQIMCPREFPRLAFSNLVPTDIPQLLPIPAPGLDRLPSPRGILKLYGVQP